MSRTTKSVRNVNISILFLIFTTLMNFISRSVFIDTLGAEFVGLSATLLNILGFLNLAELGLSSAISVTLYKPLFEGDRQACCDIVSIYGFLYRIIGLSILGLGLVVSIFLPLFFENSGVNLIYVYAGFYTYLSTALIGYFINYKQTIISADQKEYLISLRYNTIVLIKLSVQITILLCFTGSYLIWLAIELLFALIYGIWIHNTINKKYKWLKTSFSRGRKVIKNYKNLTRTMLQIIPHSIGGFVLNQTDNILIYSYASLTMVAIYTNYTLVLNRATIIVGTAIRGVSASVGNLVASGDKKQCKRVFFELTSLFSIIATVATVTFLFQTEAFVCLWVGKQYLLSQSIFYLMLVATYIGISRISVGLLISGHLLFKDVWAPIAEASINLVVSLVLGYYYGIIGVVAGTVVSLTLIVMIWKPYFLYRDGFKESSKEYWVIFFRNLLFLAITIIATYLLVKYVPLPDNQTWIGFILRSIIIAVYCGLIFTSISYCFDRGTRMVLARFQNIAIKVIKKYV